MLVLLSEHKEDLWKHIYYHTFHWSNGDSIDSKLKYIIMFSILFYNFWPAESNGPSTQLGIQTTNHHGQF